MAKDETTSTAEDEGARSFPVLLSTIDDGALSEELGEAVQEITRELTRLIDQHGVDSAKGTLTLKLAFTARANGTITLTGDVATKTPKAKRGGSVFWSTKGHNLTPDNPRQQKLPLREVPNPTRERRELAADERVRSL